MAQPGSASALGAEGREFESLRPDQLKYFFLLDIYNLYPSTLFQM